MYPIPKEFEERMKRELGEEAATLLQSLELPVHTSVLLNPSKKGADLPLDKQVPWCDFGYFLKERPSFTLDPMFHAGSYYPQESSSMFLHHVLQHLSLEVTSPMALDVCAAPGGKSIILSEYLKKKGGRLICNEINKTRNHILCENLSKWGTGNTLVTGSDSKHFTAMRNYFDLVLVDAPCSGEGMFRKDELARKEWSPGAPISCSTRQKEILENIIPSIKSGGFLIYSTCTFAREENEEVLQWLIASGYFSPVNVPVRAEWNIRSVESQSIHAYKFFPHLVEGEGLFMAVLQKTPDEPGNIKTSKKSDYKSCNAAELSALDPWVEKNNQHVIKDKFDQCFVSSFTQEEINTISDFVFLTQPGISIGKCMKGDFIPDHALALSSLLSVRVHKQELTMAQALNYLRGEPVSPDGRTGWTVVTYRGNALGWIKAMANRTNNYYPKQWRIRMK